MAHCLYFNSVAQRNTPIFAEPHLLVNKFYSFSSTNIGSFFQRVVGLKQGTHSFEVATTGATLGVVA